MNLLEERMFTSYKLEQGNISNNFSLGEYNIPNRERNLGGSPGKSDGGKISTMQVVKEESA